MMRTAKPISHCALKAACPVPGSAIARTRLVALPVHRPIWTAAHLVHEPVSPTSRETGLSGGKRLLELRAISSRRRCQNFLGRGVDDVKSCGAGYQFAVDQ